MTRWCTSPSTNALRADQKKTFFSGRTSAGCLDSFPCKIERLIDLLCSTLLLLSYLLYFNFTMSAYRLFIQDSRVATAVRLDDGSFLQVYPDRFVFPDQEAWVFTAFWEHRNGARAYTLAFPDGSRISYVAEAYTLFQAGRCRSAGHRVGNLYVQRYPYVDVFASRDRLLAKRARRFGVSTRLRLRVKFPVVSAPPAPKERVSYWQKLSQEQREAWKDKMQAARLAAKERRAAPQQREEVQFISVLDSLRSQGLAEDDCEDSYYDEEDFARMHPSLAMVFRALGPIRKSGEGCDCGDC